MTCVQEFDYRQGADFRCQRHRISQADALQGPIGEPAEEPPPPVSRPPARQPVWTSGATQRVVHSSAPRSIAVSSSVRSTRCMRAIITRVVSRRRYAPSGAQRICRLRAPDSGPVSLGPDASSIPAQPTKQRSVPTQRAANSRRWDEPQFSDTLFSLSCTSRCRRRAHCR